MKSRAYKSGTVWCFWRWTEVDSEYIVRLHIVKTPWFAICVHWINKADPEPFLHDHPVSFLSLILRGGYTELRRVPGFVAPVPLHHRWFNFIKASPSDCHSIIYVEPRTVTLCIMGPKTREWGFAQPAGWVMWKDYYAEKRRMSNAA